MTYVTWFDPGMSTGIVMAWFSPEDHYDPRRIYQIPGGPEGLLRFIERHDTHPGRHIHPTRGAVVNDAQFNWFSDIWGSEKFIPRPIDGGSHTLESTIPLVGEGVLIAKHIMPAYPNGNWQPATSQVLRRSRDNDPEKNKKLTDDLLKAKGLWLTGTDIGAPDANDALSATKHILWYLTRTLKHKPTLEWLYGEESA